MLVLGGTSLCFPCVGMSVAHILGLIVLIVPLLKFIYFMLISSLNGLCHRLDFNSGCVVSHC